MGGAKAKYDLVNPDRNLLSMTCPVRPQNLTRISDKDPISPSLVPPTIA